MMGPMNLARRLTGGGDPVGTMDDIIPAESPLFGILDKANVNLLQVQKSKVVLFCKAEDCKCYCGLNFYANAVNCKCFCGLHPYF